MISGIEIGPFLEPLPPALRDAVAAHWGSFVASLDGAPLPLDEALLPELCRVWACSEFVARHCARDPALLVDLIDSGDLHRDYPADTCPARVQAAVADCTDADGLARALRRLRRREMVRIAWRDIAGHADLWQTTADLSALAEACIRGALSRLQDWLEADWGTPVGAASGEPQRLVVLGMGKLGAGELNFSSDVDLVFAFPEDGETSGAAKTRSNEEFFVRLGRDLIRVLDENTAEGFVFRVDMRLRPFGNSGALALSFEAMENYYQVHGREWERYALIKARPVAGRLEDGERLMGLLRPFVYRRYLDYGSFAELRGMKAMVAAEVRRKGLADNVKLGAGGIREVEFIAQAFQLVRGGREPALQQRELRRVLDWLGERDYLPRYVVDQLLEAYVFLRDTEHRLQEYRDRQTHDLPADEPGRQRLAFAMGFAGWDDFLPALRGHMARVHSHFEQVFEAPQADGEGNAALQQVWLGALDEAASLATLREAGFGDAGAVLRQLRALRESSRYRGLHRTGRERLDHLMPLLLAAAGASDEADVVLGRLLRLVEAVARRSAYLALLVEHPLALSQLVRLCAASPWIASQLVRYPLLLDELLDARTLYAPASREELAAELKRKLATVDDGDLEQAMEVLRQFRHAAVLRVAAADVMDAVPLMAVSDHLTHIAEVILEEALELAWRDLVARHGPPSVAGDGPGEKGFAIIAYGKLGGIELGYGSDLDMVFLHASDEAAPPGRVVTRGPKVVADSVFYARLGQRVIHVLTALTPAGQLYEVDMRLRPSGASGLLVSSLPAFEDYQRNKAWTWEHQALVRARPVAGDARVAEGFREVRRAVLARPRDPQRLRREVREMRERMREFLSRDSAREFDLKQGRGGIADIEFMVQFGVLRWTHQAPDLADFTDNIRLLAGLAGHGFFDPDECEALAGAYRAYRAETHRLALQERPSRVPAERFGEQRETVTRLWRKYLED